MYNNLPKSTSSGSSSDETLKNFSLYNDKPVELDQNVQTAMIGFLESRNFSRESAEVIALTILTQAKREKFNPLALIETMKKLNETEMSTIIAEVLNFNRFKTSMLGSVQNVAPVDNVRRNIAS